MTDFTIFPAIDLRNGQVVRLNQGDPNQQKTYSTNPAAIARNMLEKGARWLHVVNLDGAFGESSNANLIALSRIIGIAREFQAGVQFGGGLHTLGQVQDTLAYGVTRVVLGSMAVQKPKNIRMLLQEHPSDQIAVSLDGRNKKVMVSGWQEESEIGIFELAAKLKEMGLTWLVYTDIERDGMQTGSDFETTVSLARETGMNIIASGGVTTVEEVKNLKNQGVAGAIIGRALYEGTVDLGELLAAAEGKKD
jgi:phosphoribosylformimino-5-aminoimidazole carboxamide ribotide isomerase